MRSVAPRPDADWVGPSLDPGFTHAPTHACGTRTGRRCERPRRQISGTRRLAEPRAQSRRRVRIKTRSKDFSDRRLPQPGSAPTRPADAEPCAGSLAQSPRRQNRPARARARLPARSATRALFEGWPPPRPVPSPDHGAPCVVRKLCAASGKRASPARDPPLSAPVTPSSPWNGDPDGPTRQGMP